MSNKIRAKEGYIFKRKHDGMLFGEEISLGIDYSLGLENARPDKREHYEEIPMPDDYKIEP